MIVSIRAKLVRVSSRIDPREQRIEVPTCSPNFTIIVHSAVAEFEDDIIERDVQTKLRSIEVRGDRIRHLKAGPRVVGPGVMEFTGRNAPPVLNALIMQMYDATVFDDKAVARRHQERIDYARQQAV